MWQKLNLYRRRFGPKITNAEHKSMQQVILRLKMAQLSGKGIRLTANEVSSISLDVLEDEYENFTEIDSPKGEFIMGVNYRFAA